MFTHDLSGTDWEMWLKPVKVINCYSFVRTEVILRIPVRQGRLVSNTSPLLND
jgi:hypothetical protein